jgi:hypothetical protein
MLLNYPPPTVVNLYQEYESDVQWERETLQSIRHYLNNDKYVQDDDLMLIVDGENSWFQLPSDVIIKQYARVLEDANARLLERYGTDEHGYQKFNQTIIFGAEKMCEGDDMACKYAPHSILPANTYEKEEGFDIADRPARYLNAKMLMGPARDLKVLYQAALRKFEMKHNQRHTIQSVFATILGEQQLRRDAEQKENKPASAKFKAMFVGKKGKPAYERRLEAANITLSNTTQYEFSIGMDYTHALFQPFAYCNEDELTPVLHDNSTDLSKYRHPNSQPGHLDLPSSLAQSNPPFWRLDLAKNNPSPNEKTAYIDKLAFNHNLDDLPKRKTPWNNVPLLQNTFTGSTPAIVLHDPQAALRLADPDHPPAANITWANMWYAPFRRALLRSYFRTPQSPVGYHNSLVGGDRAWDTRGGRGGIWTESEQVWLPWGEVDGVCGSLAQLKEVFADGKGVWLHEAEDKLLAEQVRLEEEMALSKKVREEREKEGERQRKKNEEEQKARKMKEEKMKEKKLKEQKMRKQKIEEKRLKEQKIKEQKMKEQEMRKQKMEEKKEQKKKEQKQKVEEEQLRIEMEEEEMRRMQAMMDEELEDGDSERERQRLVAELQMAEMAQGLSRRKKRWSA